MGSGHYRGGTTAGPGRGSNPREAAYGVMNKSCCHWGGLRLLSAGPGRGSNPREAAAPRAHTPGPPGPPPPSAQWHPQGRAPAGPRGCESPHVCWSCNKNVLQSAIAPCLGAKNLKAKNQRRDSMISMCQLHPPGLGKPSSRARPGTGRKGGRGGEKCSLRQRPQDKETVRE